MSRIREITVPVTEPATEWVNGRALQKVSPQEPHARVQIRLGAALSAWADDVGAGRIGSDWEFRVTPPGEATRPLVPDIAFLSYDRLGYDQDDAARIPYLAPDVAVEIISPGDRRADIEDKIRTYLAAGTHLALVVDPSSRTLDAHDATQRNEYGPDDIFIHSALPGFALRVGSVFEKPRPRRR